MLESLAGNLHRIIQTSHWLAPLAAFLGGTLTASNPCVLVMIPLMIGVTVGSEETRGIARSLVFSGLFVIGLSITFTILGIIAALGGRLFGDVGDYWKYIVAVVAFVMGAHLLGFFQFRFSIPVNTKFLKKGNLSSPLLLGMLFGVVSTPCAVPILALLLTYIATKGSSMVYGGILLLLYALGHCVLVVVASTSVGAAKALIESKGGRKASSILRKTGGVLVILVGLYFVFL